MLFNKYEQSKTIFFAILGFFILQKLPLYIVGVIDSIKIKPFVTYVSERVTDIAIYQSQKS